MTLLTLFLYAIVSDTPFCSSNESSMYCLGVIIKPTSFYNFKLKSLSTMNNDGSPKVAELL